MISSAAHAADRNTYATALQRVGGIVFLSACLHLPALAEPPASPELPPPPTSVPALKAVPIGVSMGMPILVGDVTVGDLIPGYQKQIPNLQACFGPYGGDWNGEVLVRLTIDSDGMPISSAIATTTLGAPDVEACLLRALSGAVFNDAPGREPVTVVLPLSFYPE